MLKWPLDNKADQSLCVSCSVEPDSEPHELLAPEHPGPEHQAPLSMEFSRQEYWSG